MHATIVRRRMAGTAAFIAGVLIGVTILSGTAWAPPASPLRVQEQNLDASGNIKVHEQGTAMTTVTNLPVDEVGDLRISGGSAPRGRTVQIVTDPVTIAADDVFLTEFQDTADCANLAVFWEEGGGILLSLEPSLILSPDGVYQAGGRPGVLQGPSAYFPAFGPGSQPIVTPHTSMPAVTPFGAIEFHNFRLTDAVLSRAWLYCSR